MTTSERPTRQKRNTRASTNGAGEILSDAQIVSAISRRALNQTDIEVVKEDALITVKERLGTDLVKILELVPSGVGFLLTAGIGWQPGYVGQVVVPLAPESQAGYTMQVGHAIVVEDLREETRFKGMPLLHEHGVISGISTPLRGQDRVHGIITAHTRKRHTFTPQDIAFFDTIASVVAAAMDRRERENELAEANQRLILAMEAGHLGAWEWNPHTNRVIWSDEVYRTYGLRPEEFGGTVDHYMALIHPADRDVVGARIAEALETGRLEMQYRIVRPDGEVRWLMSRGMVVRNERDEPLRVTGVCSDETDRLLAEKRLATQYAVTRVLAEATSRREALQGVLTAICQNLDWAVGQMWLPDIELGELRLSDRFEANALDNPAFAEISRTTTFKIGEGLPGTVLATGKPVWLEDLGKSDNFPRRAQALETGLRSAFGFPILLNREVMGVVEFFTPEPRKEKTELIEAMAAIGHQVGEYIQRRTIEADRERLMFELKSAETRYRSVFEQVNDAILVTNNTAHFVETNQAALDLLGVSSDELLGQSISDIVVGWTPGQFKDLVISGEWSGHLELRRKAGPAVPVDVNASKIILQSGEVFVAVVRDITERRRLEQQREFLTQASGVLASSLNHEVILAALARLCVPFLGDWCAIDMFEEDELRRVALVHRDPAKVEWAEELRRRSAQSPARDTRELRMLKQGQSLLISEVTPALIRKMARDPKTAETLIEAGLKSLLAVPISSHGRTAGVLTIAIDESDRHYTDADKALAEDLGRRAGLAVDNAQLYAESRAAEEKLRLANAAKDEFLGLISHEMRTPMTTIHGGSRLLRRSWQRLDEESREGVLGDIEQQTERLQRIVEDLLALARVELGEEVEKEPVLVQRLVEQAVTSYNKRRPKRVIELYEDPGTAPVNGSQIYLEQVLLNLLSNADKYSPPDQPIQVHTEMREDHVVISVLDRGPGIPLEDMDRIFERFFRSSATADRAGGAGIGLTVCQRLIQALSGTIWAEAREGGGLIVSFSLPAYDDQSQ